MLFSLEGEAFTYIIWNSFFNYYFIYWHVCAHAHTYMKESMPGPMYVGQMITFQSQFCPLGPRDETQVVSLSSRRLGLLSCFY